MAQKLELSKKRLPNKFRPAKCREWSEIEPNLQRTIHDLCEGRLKWPLFLYGDVGSGKTCAALCLVDRIANAEFWPITDLVARVWDVRKGRASWNQCGHGG